MACWPLPAETERDAVTLLDHSEHNERVHGDSATRGWAGLGCASAASAVGADDSAACTAPLAPRALEQLGLQDEDVILPASRHAAAAEVNVHSKKLTKDQSL